MRVVPHSVRRRMRTDPAFPKPLIWGNRIIFVAAEIKQYFASLRAEVVA
jgi:hypothetical protein